MKKIFYALCIVLSAFFVISCNKFLDVMPDNRAEIDSPEKAAKLLVSAYPVNGYLLCSELSSDNVDYYGETNPYGDRFSEDIFFWRDGQETSNESPARVWAGCYGAIAAANQVLDAIKDMGTPDELLPFKGEALICRAYAHFILTNFFGLHYSPLYSDTDMGVPYMEQPEKELNPQYERPSVASNYEKMAADIEEGLPLINDAVYNVPKYHFNKSAAYAFASRFYLYYQDWDKVIQYATVALGASPQTLLRDNAQLATYPRDPLGTVSTQYIAADNKCNFLLLTGYSTLGVVFGAYYTSSRYSHGSVLSTTETIRSRGPWGNFTTNTFYLNPWVYSGTNLDKVLLPRHPYLFEYTDPVAGIGYNRTVYVAFTAEETLLNRAEAYIHKKDYTGAMADITLWVNNTVKTGANLVTEASIETWANSYAYHTPTAPTPKKELNPDFVIDSGKQESFIQFLLYIRRHETIHMGLRWFDQKRYGMTATRRLIQSGAVAAVIEDNLEKRDPRYAIQIPYDVVSAGIAPNPR